MKIQDLLIENEYNQGNIDLIKNVVHSVAENNGVRVEFEGTSPFWYGDEDAVEETKEETYRILKFEHSELF